MESTKPIIGVLAVGGYDASQAASVIDLLGGTASVCRPDADSEPLHALCIVGSGAYGLTDEPVPALIRASLVADIPVLAIEGGMHALNIALGGGPPVITPSHCGEDGQLSKDGMFMALGSKLADTIGGAGFVSAASCHSHGISRAVLAPGTLASAYSTDDGMIEAFEVTANRWVIAVQWPAQRLGDQPSGFDNLFHALIGHASGE
ncbi:MAG: gamma-glutamyl-gamma-aminobutyrate hydrolase family protein [Chloroflexi bacterium]|nr:gamma-glutamyl-gamma-aminobutyrate hydrolase family protein [Chloroflexota bacterium]